MRQLRTGRINKRARTATGDVNSDVAGVNITQFEDVGAETTAHAADFGLALHGDFADPMETRYPGVSSQYAMGHGQPVQFMDAPGNTYFDSASRNIAANAAAENLTTVRDIGSIPGTNRIIRPIGPVRAHTANWTGNMTAPGQEQIGIAGPVGRSDYASQLRAIFAAQYRATYDQAQATAALVAAV